MIGRQGDGQEHRQQRCGLHLVERGAIQEAVKQCPFLSGLNRVGRRENFLLQPLDDGKQRTLVVVGGALQLDRHNGVLRAYAFDQRPGDVRFSDSGLAP